MKAWLPLLLTLLSAPRLDAQRHPQAEKLVSAWIDAAGGERVWDGVRDLRYTITTVWYDSAGHELRRRPRYVWIKKTTDGFRVRVERTEAEGRYLQIWNDGERASLNGVWLPDTARAVREVQYVASELTYWIGLPWKLRDPGVQLSYLELDNTHIVHVHFGSGVGLHDGDRFWYYWRDASSPFPTEVHYIEEGLSEVDRKVWLLRQPTRLGPGVFFARRTMQNARGVAARDLLISDVVVNRGMRDSLFR
ncbi:MAG TPA: hypothetical protein VGD27_10840 [Longimicrobiales bacterium]